MTRIYSTHVLHFLLPSLFKKTLSGEAAPGCSAHEDGCDGSTGIEKQIKKELIGFLSFDLIFISRLFLIMSSFHFNFPLKTFFMVLL